MNKNLSDSKPPVKKFTIYFLTVANDPYLFVGSEKLRQEYGSFQKGEGEGVASSLDVEKEESFKWN